jgi:radical SAM-linked protein
MAMRLRITFSKSGPMQYVGHLDLHRAWERAFRRSGLPLEYSQGFHPQPHLNLACALPLGFTSQCELLDAWLEAEHPIQAVLSALQPALPPGLSILDLEAMDLHTPALQTQVISACYRITFLDTISDLPERLQRVLAAEHLPRQRRSKAYDLRPLIEEAQLTMLLEDGKYELYIRLAARESATGRPEELLSELGINFEDTRIHREKLVLSPN